MTTSGRPAYGNLVGHLPSGGECKMIINKQTKGRVDYTRGMDQL